MDSAAAGTLASYAPEVTFNLRYPGQQWDDETGLAFNVNRYYNSQDGRYIQTDPIGLDGGWNRFAYVASNPLKYGDPTGKIAVVDDLVVGGLVLGAGCLMSPGCRDLVGGAINSAADACSAGWDRVFNQKNPDPLAPAGNAGHSSGASESTRGKHEAGDARRGRDRGGESGDSNRGLPRRKPDGWKGPWPPK